MTKTSQTSRQNASWEGPGWLRPAARSALLAVLAAVVGLVTLGASGAGAATLAPTITEHPDAHETTNAIPMFKFEADENEPDEDTDWFLCRMYPAASPPGPDDGWSECGGLDTFPVGVKYYANLANGDYTFEVATFRRGQRATRGPADSFDFELDVAEPTLAPQIAEGLTDPQVDPVTHFTFSGGEGEEGTPRDYECRVNPDSSTPWTKCQTNETSSTREANPSTFTATLGNGTHTLEVRAKDSSGGDTPVSTFQWTVAVPNDIQPGVPAAASSLITWRGDSATGSTVGGIGAGNPNSAQQPSTIGIENAGDVDGDGRDDLVAFAESTARSYVLFSSPSGGSTRKVDEISPDEGYAMVAKSGSQIQSTGALSDQNGDGVPDFWVQRSGGQVNVVYGVSDPSSLMKCVPNRPVRCVDVSDLSDDQGYGILDPSPMTRYGTMAIGPGDFDGDGTDDILLYGSFGALGFMVVKGGVERSGDIDPTSLPAGETFKFQHGTFSPGLPRTLGDMNGDGKDDLFVQSMFSDVSWIVYGQVFAGETLSPDSEFGSSDGILVASGLLTVHSVANAGDINGDGVADLSLNQGAPVNVNLTNYFMPATPDDDFVLLPGDLSSGGYMVNGFEGPPNFSVSAYVRGIGDMNNDGVPDQVAGTPYTSANGSVAGAAYVLLGQRPAPEEPLEVGPGLDADTGIALLGSKADDGVGYSATSLGDIDGDGVPDLAVGAPGVDDGTGEIYLVPGGNLLAPVRTISTDSTNTSAKLAMRVRNSGRDTDVKVEYGTSDSYGESADGSVAGDSTGDLSVQLDGLEKGTTYHYRVVTTNEMGTLYGDDQTFTTTSDANPGGDPCVENPGAAGCAKYCEVNPTAMGCPDYDWCANNPGKCSQGGGKTKARLALIATTKRIAIKRGRKGVLRVAVVNTGGKQAKGVKVCVKAPKRLVRVKRCVKVGKLASGKSRIVKVKVKAKRRRGKAVLKVTAKGKKLSAKRAKARVIVR